MNERGSAVFIEAQGSLRAALLAQKARLETRMPGQSYTLHPPHCTLIFGDYGSPEAWIGTLRRQVAAFPPFALTTDGWQEFPSDILAGGGHTLAYRVTRGSELGRLQMIVADILAPFRQPRSVPHPLAECAPFAASLQRYGFPFVGPHWIPHFTIGSPRVPGDSPLLAELRAFSPRDSMEVDRVSIWEVDGDHHQRRCELAFLPPTFESS